MNAKEHNLPWKPDATSYSDFIFGDNSSPVAEVRGLGHLQSKGFTEERIQHIIDERKNLISAAPEMMEVLGQLLAYFRDVKNPPITETEAGVTKWGRIIKKAQRAYDKAQGKKK